MTLENWWRESVLERSREAHKRITLTAQEAFNLGGRMRPLTRQEAADAVARMGLTGVQDERDNQRCCTSCATWKNLTEYVPKGLFYGEMRYSKQCKTCLADKLPKAKVVRRQTKGLTEKDCPRCGIVQPVDKFPKDGRFKDGTRRYHTFCMRCKLARRKQLTEEAKHASLGSV